jgi:glutathione S-transferase
MRHTINVINSTIASSIRAWRGTSSSRTTIQPEKPIILFDQEGDPECRLVREVLTGLNLDVVVMPCPRGGRNIRQLRRDSGSDTIPVLYDSNVEERRVGANEIIRYLYLEYKQSEPPERVKTSALKLRLSRLSTLTRLNAGVHAKPSIPAEQALTLYSFESSPFSRLVRELMCELEIPYLLVNLGKQQAADMGPAKPRLLLKPYQPLPNTKRAEFFAKHGNVQVPYLEDPNTGEALFESAEIVAYLKKHYAK